MSAEKEGLQIVIGSAPLSATLKASYHRVMIKLRLSLDTIAATVADAKLRTSHRVSAVPEGGGRPDDVMTPDQRAAVDRSLAQMRRGEIASDDDVEAVFRLFG